MSELTNERLEEIASGQNTVSIPEAVELARELLALRTLRDAGDEEVERPRGGFRCSNCAHELTKDSVGRYGCEHCDHEYESDCQCPSCSLQSKIATLTAERDQWKKQCESECQYGYLRQDELDAVKAELAAIKSCPAMAELDDILTPWVGQPFKSIIDDFEEMRTVARRSIASREEVVGLLKWLDEFWDFKEVKKCLCEYASDKVYGDDQQKARRILEIVGGK